VFDEQMKLEYINGNFERLAGMSLEDIEKSGILRLRMTEIRGLSVKRDFSKIQDLTIEMLNELLFLKKSPVELHWFCEKIQDTEGNKLGNIFLGLENKLFRCVSSDISSSSEHSFKALEVLPIFAGIFSKRGELNYINEFPLVESNLTREKVIGKSLEELPWLENLPESVGQLRYAIEKAYKGGSVKLQVPILNNSKVKEYFVFSISPYFRGGGLEPQVAVIGFEYRKLNMERGHTSRLIDAIIENIPSIIFMKGAADLRFEYFNRAAEELIGIKRSELLGRNDYDFFPKEQADFFIAKDRMVLDHVGVIDIPEEPITTPKGTRYLHTKKVALRDENGKPQYLIGVSEDITERKLTEEKLRFQAKIIDQIHDSVVSTDLDGIVNSWNKGAERLHGYKEEEMLGQSILLLVPLEKREGLINAVINPLLEKGEYEVEETLLHKNGTRFIGHLSFSMLFDSEKNPVGIIGFCIDITERKLLESELDSYRDLLESQVIERTAALVAARDEAERANQAKSQFLSKMSHELRTPLNAILGFAQMMELEGGSFNNEQRENVEEILQAGRHLLNLINDVLDLSKIESGKFEISIETVSVSELLHQCIPLVSREADIRSVRINDRVSENDYYVKADFSRLKQVLLNLLSNAIKYNKMGGEVFLGSFITDTGRFRLIIRDTGRGLSEIEIEKLFRPFSRLNGTSNIEGTGIGLVITKEIVVAMGGLLGVESVVGEGSSFWIELDYVKLSTSNYRV